MTSSIRLGLMAGIFVAGGFGGAVALHVSRVQEPASPEKRAADSAPVVSQRGALDLDELRAALASLGVSAQRDEAEAVQLLTHQKSAADASTAEDDAAGDVTAEAAAGEAAADILRRLEEDYRASLQRKHSEFSQAALASNASQAADPLHAPLHDAPSQAPGVGQADQLPRETFPAPVAARAEPTQAVQGNVHYGDTNLTTLQETHVQETHLSQTAINYQQLFLLAPQAISNARVASPAPQRRPGASPQDSNPWASVDYGSHYANPWGSSFSGRP